MTAPTCDYCHAPITDYPASAQSTVEDKPRLYHHEGDGDTCYKRAAAEALADGTDHL